MKKNHLQAVTGKRVWVSQWSSSHLAIHGYTPKIWRKESEPENDRFQAQHLLSQGLILGSHVKLI